jgi:hypothetical protein
VLVIFTIKDRAALLPYFLRYYQRMGATRFLCYLFNGAQNPLYPEVEAWKSKVPLIIRASLYGPAEEWTVEEETMVIEADRRLMPPQWHVMADLDEFYLPPCHLDLPQAARELARQGYQAAMTCLTDRIAADGTLPPPGPTLDETYPLACNLTDLLGALCDKVMLVRSDVPLWPGHHTIVNPFTPFRSWGQVHHFKWLPGILSVLRERYACYLKLPKPSHYAHESLGATTFFSQDRLDLARVRTWPAVPIGI